METEWENIHRRVRKQHALEVSQDYVEAIYEIESSGELVQVSKLQTVFGVSHVTVIKTLKRLYDQELILGTKSKQIKLSEKGKKLAVVATERHRLLKDFFIKLGVKEEQANADAEGAEHHLSSETFDAIERFLAEKS